MKKLFNKYLWTLFSVFFVIAFVIFLVGETVIRENETNINYGFGINPWVQVTGEEEEVVNDYPSDFLKPDGSLDDVAMRANSMRVSEEAAAEGAVLLWNKNGALPLKENAKISFFGVSCKPKNYLYIGHGSGHVTVTTTDFPDLKQQFESENKFSVNPTLWNSYPDTQAYAILSNPNGDDNHYREFSVNEKAWNAVATSTLSPTFSSYGDAAIYIISRTGAEDGDTWFDTSKNTADRHFDDNYLDLTKNEADTLEGLCKLKGDGVFSSVILVLNTGTPMQMKSIVKYDIDACLFAGMGGNASFAALYDVMSGKVAPSGRLVDTYAYDGDSAPSAVNTGAFEFTKYGSLPAENRGSNSYNHAYIVYEEGIYVGYRYYETRYADAVMGSGNASSSAGVVAGSGNWKYQDEVKFPFGYGISYTDFSYSDFKVEKSGNDYKVSVTVENKGSVAAKTPVQVYLQKPYTEYDKEKGIEKSAVELVGYTKTGLLGPGKKETVTVTVPEYEFKTYDSYGEKTYILEKGDYYLATGSDVHDALNNILALRGYGAENGMVDSLGKSAEGNDSFAHLVQIKQDDFTKYSTSPVNRRVKVTNQFDNADILLYSGTADQRDAVTYLSRKDWQGTYPAAPVSLEARNRTFVTDMQYSSKVEADPDAVMPKYGEITNPAGKLNLANMKGLSYSDEHWENLLDQLTWEETITICGVGNHIISACPSVASPPVLAYDGPAGVREKVPEDVATSMAFPGGVLLASTWNEEVVEKVCRAFGNELIHAGVGEIYGTGAGIHRSVYGGRNWEYFSEDPFISGRTLTAEVKGLQGKGAIVNIKHFALNDQEIYRCGTTTWANEQAIREIYLKAFEPAVTEGHANGVMSSLNRLGCIWVGRHKGLLTDVLRNEWGFIGLVETDSATGLYMRLVDARAEAIVAGNDLWLRGNSNGELWTGYENNPTVACALRESAHRILYTVLNSAAMDGVGNNTQWVYEAPWYYGVITAGQAVSGTLAAISIAMAVASFVMPLKKKEKKGGEV